MRRTLWTAGARDWEAEATPELIAERILAAATPGAILLLHDSDGDPGAPEHTLAALPAILAGFRERGLRSVTLSELVALRPQPTTVELAACMRRWRSTFPFGVRGSSSTNSMLVGNMYRGMRVAMCPRSSRSLGRPSPETTKAWMAFPHSSCGTATADGVLQLGCEASAASISPSSIR